MNVHLNDIDLNKFIGYYGSPHPGIYALFLKDVDSLKALAIKDEACFEQILNRARYINDQYHVGLLLYIGQTTRPLKKRITEHLSQTPKSTLRRTLAAIADLQGIFINKHETASHNAKKKHYDISSQNNKALTDWLKDYTVFKIYECTKALLKDKSMNLECKYIEKYGPPLNLDDNPRVIKCVDVAKKAFEAHALLQSMHG